MTAPDSGHAPISINNTADHPCPLKGWLDNPARNYPDKTLLPFKGCFENAKSCPANRVIPSQSNPDIKAAVP